MPFTSLPFEPSPMKQLCGSISYKRSKRKDGPNGKPRLIISIPKAIAGDPLPEDSDRWGLDLGSGEDAGKLRIVPAMVGVKCVLLKWVCVWRFGYVPLLGDEAAEIERCEAKRLNLSSADSKPSANPQMYGARSADQVVGGCFELVLPAWFKGPSQTSVAEAPEPAPSPRRPHRKR